MIKAERQGAFLTRWTLLSCLAVLLVVPGLATAQSQYSGIVVFGTSLSDSGNAFVLVGDQSTPPDFDLNPLLIPSAPYARGGHHFSNGPTWIEQYARSVGLGGSVRPALGSSSLEATNFAVGAARAYNDGSNYNLSRQVDTFLQRNGGASPQALYAIEMGGNDVRDAFQVYLTGGVNGPAMAAAILNAAVNSIAVNIQRLYAAGATNFVVWSSPRVALTPAIRSLGPQAGFLADSLTQAFNAGLTQAIGQLTLALPGSSFARLDAYQLQTAIVAAPAAFNLSNVTTACVASPLAPWGFPTRPSRTSPTRSRNCAGASTSTSSGRQG